MATIRTGITAPTGALVLAALVALFAAGAALGATAKPEARKAGAADSTRAAALVRPATARTPAQSGPRGKDTVRTLDAINIEGEIAVPQVLFITARDVRRYRDGMGLKFQLSATEAGRSAVLPSRLRVAPQSQSNKEE